ncbi:peptidoglycan-recognition protein LF-like [Drosophila ficusphila]|uniref:peptidoglycan-recognition protein LF-like n=1 Tax=Drosophila ficusphila TaxID=30025 RepID=UPI0007E5D968|nr:peptidoglycan-recognition protein LF-like [Drosophila ficusphila]
METLELNDLLENQDKRLKIKRLWIVVFFFFLITLPVGYYIWIRSHKNDLLMIERDEWGAKEPIEREFLNLPATTVVICHTATGPCETKAACIRQMQTLQDFHMNSQFRYDISLNFLVGGDGEIYEGRGWDVKAQHLNGDGSVSISIAFIGTFSNVEPPARQVDAAKRLMLEGVRRGKLHQDYRVYGHRQFQPTESPGQKLYELIKQWPRWSTIIKHISTIP